MKTKVTIQEIAHFTGLSKFAVSRALSGKSGVSEQTRDVILKAAGKLDISKITACYLVICIAAMNFRTRIIRGGVAPF